MSRLEIASLHIHCVQDNNKRKKIFQNFDNSKCDIILLLKHIVLIKTLLSGKKTIQVGVEILCKESKSFKAEFQNSDKAGHIISVTVETQKNEFQLTNIYAPNMPPKRKTFDKLKYYVSPKYKVILGGDYSMVENFTIDRQGGNHITPIQIRRTKRN